MNRDSTLVKSGSGLSGVYYQPSHFRVGRHRGEHQVIFVPTAHSLANLASAGVVYVGLTYIGKRAHREYVTALKNSKVIKLIPIIIIAGQTSRHFRSMILGVWQSTLGRSTDRPRAIACAMTVTWESEKDFPWRVCGINPNQPERFSIPSIPWIK